MKTKKRIQNSQRNGGGTAAAHPPMPALEEIQHRAYEIFLARGGAPGKELDDWLLAEWELKESLARAIPVQTRFPKPRINEFKACIC